MIQSLQYLAGSHTDSSTCLTWKGVPYSAVLVELHLLVTHLGLQVHHFAFSVFYLVTHLGLQSPTYCGIRELICSARITTDSDFNRFIPGKEPDSDTGMWVVRLEFQGNGCHIIAIIHIYSIARAAHLLPVFGSSFVPEELHFSDAL